ncbi:MAG: dTDP-4-dehydrorhamnose reductase [Candidatus Omnitrophica bacterium]|nr:dTDP-4-dehydrorhamnose reductase [Candidatus Omnitrophota bacterium]
MKILITGSTGLLGQALSRWLARFGEVIGLSRHASPAAGAGCAVACDLLDAAEISHVVQDVRPELVIHAQALSDVDRCEREPEAARAQNVTTTANVIGALRAREALLVYVSTDYVFDGKKGAAYDETDEPNQVNVYGRSKWEAERLVLRRPNSVVARPSTLFGPGRMNFCDDVVAKVQAGEPIEAFADQVTSPTYTVDVAEAIQELSARLLAHWDARWPRIYHLANAGGCSRVAFAERIVKLMGGSRRLVRPISMADQRRPAPRPAYSVLATSALSHVVGRRLRPWEEALHAYLAQRRSGDSTPDGVLS